MTVSKALLFNELLNNFLKINSEVEAIILSDEEGLIIAGEKRKDVDMELVSILTVIVNPVMQRFRSEFAYKKFGTAIFDTEAHRILFITIDEEKTLSLILESSASLDKLSPYAYFLAEKSAQILSVKEIKSVQVTIPNLEYATEGATDLSQMKLVSGADFRFKFIVIGDHEVGKTSIIRRFVEKRFLADYRTTIGLNIISHNFEFFGNKISLNLWDIGAQEFFKRYRQTYYRGAQAAFIVFDLTKRESFGNLVNWYEELKSYEYVDEMSVVIVGNKTDLTEQREIQSQEGIALANKLSEGRKVKISYMETSALSGENIEEAFGLVSYHYILRCKDLEEETLKKEIVSLINSILAQRPSLILSFLTQNLSFSPGIKLLTEIRELGGFAKIDKKKFQLYKYPKGLILKNYLYDSMDVFDSNGIFCVFDARNRDHIDPKWTKFAGYMIKNVKDNSVILVGILTHDKKDWSKLMEEFDVNKYLEKKPISFLLFKIGAEYRLDVYEQIKTMLNTIQGSL